VYKAIRPEDVLRRKRERDRIRYRYPEKYKELCNRERAEIRPIKQAIHPEKYKELCNRAIERKLLKELSSKVQWYKCKICNSLKYIKGRYNENEICSRCIKIGCNWALELKQYICPICNKEHIAKNNRALCKECKKSNNKITRRKAKYKRSALIRKATTAYGVDPLYIFNRDRYKCKFCGIKVQKKNIHADNAAELDHIVPISRGGHHADYNCQTLCRKCNQSKSNKMIGQLLIPL
jgi:hypothetical protein